MAHTDTYKAKSVSPEKETHNNLLTNCYGRYF